MAAIARAAGIIINWDDYAAISQAVPLICKIYPNGIMDVNHFHAAGGMAYLIGELIHAGLMQADVTTVAGGDGLHAYTKEPIKNVHLEKDTVVWREGPRANGMPELHKLTPILGLQQDKGFKVAMVTDGRMSGASGKVPAAIHLHPEALMGGAIARIQTGDLMRVDPENNTVEVVDVDLSTRTAAVQPPQLQLAALGMNMFGTQRAIATDAESGASTLGDMPWFT